MHDKVFGSSISDHRNSEKIIYDPQNQIKSAADIKQKIKVKQIQKAALGLKSDEDF